MSRMFAPVAGCPVPGTAAIAGSLANYAPASPPALLRLFNLTGIPLPAPPSPAQRKMQVSGSGGDGWVGKLTFGSCALKGTPGAPGKYAVDGNLIVQESDGGTSVSGVCEIQFKKTQFSVTDAGGGTAHVESKCC